jgi:hypothetical protein
MRSASCKVGAPAPHTRHFQPPNYIHSLSLSLSFSLSLSLSLTLALTLPTLIFALQVRLTRYKDHASSPHSGESHPQTYTAPLYQLRLPLIARFSVFGPFRPYNHPDPSRLASNLHVYGSANHVRSTSEYPDLPLSHFLITALQLQNSWRTNLLKFSSSGQHLTLSHSSSHSRSHSSDSHFRSTGRIDSLQKIHRLSTPR